MEKGELSNEDYEKFIEEEIARWIKIQEDLDIDVLVHGEFERTDMVEFFGQRFAGFASTKFGWVQSYGSRGVKPPIIYGDVKHIEAVTVKETAYAQSLTNRPVKGMLTGPVTILNWSFERSDIPKAEIFNQIAIALKMKLNYLKKLVLELSKLMNLHFVKVYHLEIVKKKNILKKQYLHSVLLLHQ